MRGFDVVRTFAPLARGGPDLDPPGLPEGCLPDGSAHYALPSVIPAAPGGFADYPDEPPRQDRGSGSVEGRADRAGHGCPERLAGLPVLPLGLHPDGEGQDLHGAGSPPHQAAVLLACSQGHTFPPGDPLNDGPRQILFAI
jgi:hypothetical protein